MPVDGDSAQTQYWPGKVFRPTQAAQSEGPVDSLAWANGFHTHALTINREGVLSTRQRLSLFGRVVLYLLAMAAGAFVALVALNNHQAEASFALICAVLLLAFAVLLWRCYANLSDAWRGRVTMAEGCVTATHDSDADSVCCYYHLGDLRFAVSEAGYEALTQGETYRLYYTPRSKTLVNIESV